MATTKKPRKKREKVTQPFLDPSMEPIRCPILDQKAETYYDRMMARVELSKEEDEAKTDLIAEMLKQDLVRYETLDNFVVEVTDKKNVKVKRKKDVSANGDGEEAADE